MLSTIESDAKRVRDSLTYGAHHDPRADNFQNTYEGISERDRAIRRRTDPMWLNLVAECAELIHGVRSGTRPDWHLKEAMTTADFPLLFGDLLYRQMLGNYVPFPVSYPAYFRIVEVNDFRTLNLYTIDGGTAALKAPAIRERGPYPEVRFTEGRYQVSVSKYGRRYSITFEMVINDDLNAFNDRAGIMAVGARRGEEWLATGLIADSAGPHASFYTSGNANIVTSNPVLSTEALAVAYGKLRAQTDADGEPILIDSITLVVPPALEIAANNIKNAVQLWITGAERGATATQALHVDNWFGQRLNVAVNSYLPSVITTGSRGSTSWFLFANPNDAASRPAMVFAFMRGRRTPQLFVKDSNQINLGGGPADVLEGDFETDSIDYKIRHIFGGAQADPKMSVASNGTGS